MAVDRRAKPYYYLSCADVDDDHVDIDDDALKDCTREDVARFLISILCKTKGKNTLENILTRKLQPLKLWNITTPSALKEFCQSFRQCFIIHGLPGAEASYVEVEVTTEMNLCCTHLKKTGSCPEDGECGSLHLCRFFMLAGKCECGTPKQVQRLYGHQLRSDHNISILKSHLMDHLTLEEVQTLIRRPNARRVQMRPLVCRFYNNQTGCCKGDRCMMLHLCKRFVFAECKFGKDCMRSHDPTDPLAKAILDRYALAPEDLLFVMQQDDSHDKNAPPLSKALLLTAAHTKSRGGSAVLPPPRIHPAEGTGEVSAISGEKDELRGGHWRQPSLTGSSEAGSSNSSTAVKAEGEQSRTVSAEPAVFSTLFSRRRGHVAVSCSSQETLGTAVEKEKDGGDQPAPTFMNPFSYMTVREQHRQAGLDGRPAATITREDNIQSDCVDSTSKADPASKKAEDGPLAPSQDSNFIPLKQVDKMLGVKLAPGRPVASVTPQMKIKPELGICRKMDGSSEDVEFGSKERRDGFANKELSVNAGNQMVVALPELSSSEKPSKPTPSSAPTQSASLHCIITNLIDNVKKLHAKNPGPERHLMNYLSELAQPDKLDKEMKAAENNEGNEGARGPSPGPGDKYRSDGEISDSDHEMEEKVNPVQEKVLFDYNHRPTVDLISDMLNSGEYSPCKETPGYDISVSCSSGPHRVGKSSFSSHNAKGGSQYPAVPIPKSDRDLEEISSANSAISDIMSSEEDPPDSDITKTTVALKDSKNEDSTSKDSKSMNNTQEGTNSKLAENPHKDEKLKAQAGKSETSCQQSKQDVKSSSEMKTSSVTVPTKNTHADETGKTLMSSDRGQKSSERSATGSDHSVGAKPPIRSRSSPSHKSAGLGSSSQVQKQSSPGRLSSDAGKSSAGAKDSSDHKKTASKQTSSESNRSLSGVKKSCAGNTSSGTRSSPGNRSSSQRNPKSPQGRRKSPGNRSPGHRKSPGNRSSEQKSSTGDHKRSSLGNTRSEDSRRVSSDKNKASERKNSSDRRSSDRKRSDHEERRHTPSHWRSSAHRRRSSASPGKYLSGPRGCPSNRQEWSPRHRNVKDMDDRSFRSRENVKEMDDHSFRSRENKRMERNMEDGRWRSRSRERGTGSVERHPRDQYYDRDIGSRNEKHWGHSSCGERHTHSPPRDSEKHWRHSSHDDRHTHSLPRDSEKHWRHSSRDDRHTHSPPRDSEKHWRHSSRDDRHTHSPPRDSEMHWRHSSRDDRHTHSPPRDGNRFHGAEREWGTGRKSHSPSLRRQRSISHSHERSSAGRPRQQFDERWPAEERGYFESEHALDGDPPGEREEFFHGKYAFDTGSARKSPGREEFLQRREDKFWDQDNEGFDKSRSRMGDIKEGRLRNRLGPSPGRFRNQQVEGCLSRDEYCERNSHGVRDGHRSPYKERHYSSSEIHDSVEDCAQPERSGSPFLPETEFDTERNWHEDSANANRYGPSRTRSKSNKFANYAEWKRFTTPEREVVLQSNSQSEEERHLTPTQREQGRTDRRRPNIPRRSSPTHQGSSHSPSAGFRYDKRARHERSSHHHRPPQDAFHIDDSRYSPTNRKHGPASESEALALREQIDDLLDKARHSSSRGASPFQELDENSRTVIPSMEDVEMDGRPDLRVDYTDRSPEQHGVDHHARRGFRSQERRTNSAYHRPPSKRPREPLDREQAEDTFEHKRRRTSGSREPHRGGHRSWNKDSVGKGSDDRIENFEMGWEDGGKESIDSECQPHHSQRHGGHPPKESSTEVRASFPRRGRGARSRGRFQFNRYRGNAHNYARNRGGIKIKRIFNNNNCDMEAGDGLPPYQDLDQPHDDDDAYHTQGLGVQTEEDFYEENMEDESREGFHCEDDDLDQEGRDRQGDVGDMIRAQRARIMRSDLRNFLKTRRNSHYSEAESEHIQIRVQSQDNRERVSKNQYIDDDGREVMLADN